MLDLAQQSKPLPLWDVPWQTLICEMRRRGFDVLPGGAFQREIETRDREIAELKSSVAEARKAIPPGMVDASDVIGEIREIATVQFPKLVEEHVALSRENAELTRRAVRAEAEAERLAVALCRDLYGTTDEEA